ncbi:peroxiredoxin family protein [Bacteroidota bacterium]
MRNLYWLIFIVFILSCSRGEQIQVRGIVDNGDRRMIYLDEQGLGEIRKVDSSRLKQNGSFMLKDRILVPTFYNLHKGDQSIIPLLIQPGDRVEIRTDLKDFASKYDLSGSEESHHLLELNQRMLRTQSSLDSLLEVIENNPDAGQETLEESQTASDYIIQAQRRFSIQFILDHMNSMAAIYALYQKFDDDNFVLYTNRDIQLLKITSAVLDTLYPESEYVKFLSRDAANLEGMLKNREWQNIMESLPSSTPDIRLPNPDGDTISLSSQKGKIVLLSFWASWDEASVSINRDLKRLYDRYHKNGLEIYQVSFDGELEEWISAIKFDELPWINVSELSYPESIVAARYNVNEIPAIYLINRQGDILERNNNVFELERRISALIYQKQ